MWLPLGPVLEPLEDAVIALDDPVLIDGGLLHLGGRNRHAEAHLQDPAPWSHKEPGITPGWGWPAAWRRGHRGRAFAEKCLPQGQEGTSGAEAGAGGGGWNTVALSRQCGLWPGAREAWAADFRPGLSGEVRPWTLSPGGAYLLSWLLFSTLPPLLQ